MRNGARSASPGPRTLRRLAWGARGAAIVGAAALAVWLLPNVSLGPPKPFPPSPQAGGAARLPRDPAPQLRVTPALRRELTTTVRAFIDSAVRRLRTERSWSLVHPSLRQGLTRAQWRTGNIPVIPFPVARTFGLKIQEARSDGVLMEVVLVPRPGSGLGSKTFQIELRSAADRSRWLVAAWVPLGISGSQMAIDAEARGDNLTTVHPRHLSSAWLLVPLLLISLTVLVPFVVFLTGVVRDRRAHLRYRNER